MSAIADFMVMRLFPAMLQVRRARRRDEAEPHARVAGRLSSFCIVTLPRFIDRANAIGVSQVPVKSRLIDIVLALTDNTIPTLGGTKFGSISQNALLLSR